MWHPTDLLRATTRQPTDYGARPVHILNTDHDGDGLVTDVTMDCFDEEQRSATPGAAMPRIVN
jgi:hypothetical protein